MTEEKIVKLWLEFMKDWCPKNPGKKWDVAREEMIVDKKSIMKPDFFDFMSWLSNKN